MNSWSRYITRQGAQNLHCSLVEVMATVRNWIGSKGSRTASAYILCPGIPWQYPLPDTMDGTNPASTHLLQNAGNRYRARIDLSIQPQCLGEIVIGRIIDKSEVRATRATIRLVYDDWWNEFDEVQECVRTPRTRVEWDNSPKAEHPARS